MLMYSKPDLTVNPSEKVIINGRGVNRRRLSYDQLVGLAADLVTRHASLELSLEQATLVLKVRAADVRNELRRRAEAAHAEVLSATTPTTPTTSDAPPASSASTSLLDVVTRGWTLMSDSEREKAVRQFGVAATWDALSRVIA